MTEPDPAPAPAPPTQPPAGDPVPLPQPLPQPEDQDQAVESSHLFGAALFGDAPAGVFHPVPVVAIGGVDVASGTGGATRPTELMAVDGFAIHWGRTEVLDQPDPATASLQLYDPTGAWAMAHDVTGQLVTIRWTGTKPGTGPVSRVVFVGRVSKPRLRPKVTTNPDGSKSHGILLELTAASILADLANVIPTVAFPAETLEARRARVATYTTTVAPLVTVRDFWKTPNVAPVAAADQVSVLEHLVSLYASSGPDRLTFLPNTQEVRHIVRRDMAWSNRHTTAQLWWNTAGEGTARDGLGAYARSIPYMTAGNSAQAMTSAGLYLDGAGVQYPDGAITKDITSKVSRVDVSHPDEAASPAYSSRVEETLVDGVNEATSGARQARLDSIVAWNAWAQTASSDLAAMVGREGSGWRVESLRWDTRLTGGFEDFAQADGLLLVGAEVQSMVFLQRAWFTAYGVRPTFGVVGGAISYSDGGWVVDLSVIGVATAPLAQHAISWSEIDDGSATYQLEWWDGDNPRALHDSLTYEDIGFVGAGLGMAIEPTNATWDTIQL
jgi:hypothetical protein